MVYLYVGYARGFVGKVSTIGFRTMLMRQFKWKFPSTVWTSRGARRVRSTRGFLLRVFEVCHGARREFLSHCYCRVQTFLIGCRYWFYLRARASVTYEFNQPRILRNDFFRDEKNFKLLKFDYSINRSKFV